LLGDIGLGGGKCRVLVGPNQSLGGRLLLAREQLSRIGNQMGGLVFLALHPSDFSLDHRVMTKKA
jgi:lactoylglutathione lyase